MLLCHLTSASVKTFPFPQHNAKNNEKFCDIKYVANLLQCKELCQTNPKDDLVYSVDGKFSVISGVLNSSQFLLSANKEPAVN